MAAALFWNCGHAIADGPEDLGAVSVVVRMGVAEFKQGNTVLAHREDVVSVTRVAGAPNSREITFGDGTVWRCDRAKGCGCK